MSLDGTCCCVALPEVAAGHAVEQNVSVAQIE